MKKDNYSYEITEVVGIASEQPVDFHSEWCKAVLKTLLNGTDEGIDIRRYNSETKVLGHGGIRLTIQEAHNMVDILLQNGYGSMEVLEKVYNERKSLFET